jgi:hypothetical protein
MGWLILVEGTPDEPDAWNWEEIASFPTPLDFLNELFASLCNVDTRKGRTTEKTKIPGDTRVVRGFQGSERVGFRWVEEECLETSMFPVRVEHETYGLPGMEVRWRYRREYAGQLGHAAFRHDCVTARFDNEEAMTQFQGIWRAVFGKTPVFQPASTESPGDHFNEV